LDTIRVWLEPEYDHGRTGAWMLDWPGAFTWGATRSAALARATSATNRFVEWLADHGERPGDRVPVMAEIVDEVAAYRRDDGYEVNATFDADRRAVGADELDATIQRLGYARADLIDLVARVTAFRAAGGALEAESRLAEALADGAPDGRDVDDVLRHVAGAEAWFVSRLDPVTRFEGSRDDLDGYLGSTRAFLEDNLRRLGATDSGNSRIDGKGEEWTLAKLLRRALYHSLDHLEELDRRLALAERRVDRLGIRKNASFDLSALRSLFRAAGLGRRFLDSTELTERMIAGSTETVSAWDGDRLVGFGRIISDEATNGYISTVAVAPKWQDRGLGTRLMNELMAGRDALRLTLDAREGAEQFYERLGFVAAHSIFMRPRLTD
jgi:ribosomal protein S18 acetylase RimI-like enzyme